MVLCSVILGESQVRGTCDTVPTVPSHYDAVVAEVNGEALVSVRASRQILPEVFAANLSPPWLSSTHVFTL